ncbi:hypothetical protein BCV70DRAFT_11869 [Testicularia cyperi]|uniref:MARVEL domain-containing protein n=1 Tax=Testicularia cyperi TaxID=1882483 RepID=A0A317XYB1_9BASI|nr:hypothetical protein BCV70DRAFT_11869 [Testicularia cyperi]
MHPSTHGASAPSSYPSYPPVAPSSPYYQQQTPHNARRWSGDASRPASRASSSRHPFYQPPRSPLSSSQHQHPREESDEYEERDLGEIAAANQAAQEQRWGPHAALSEAPERYDETAYRGVASHRPSSMPAMPAYEPSPYDGGYYLGPPPSGYEAGPQYGYYPSPGPPSVASSHTLGGKSRRSMPVYGSPSVHHSSVSPASEPPNMFNVSAAHHAPGARIHPHSLNMYDDPMQRQRSGAHVGDPLPGFPSWSRTWYGGHLSADGHAYTMVPPPSGQSGWESETLSHGRHGMGPMQSPGAAYPAYGYGGRAGIDDYVKEERIRMLEKEFGPKVGRKGKGKGKSDDSDDEDDDGKDEPEETPIGGVNDRGRLVLPRHKMRVTTRWLQCLVSLAGAGCGIGGFVLIRPADKAPPSGTMPSFVLYGASAISTLVCVWLFVFKPCCKSDASRNGQGPGGMGGAGGGGMVVPVLGGPAGGGKRGMFGKKNKMGGMQAGTTVNLIVDPTLLGKGAAESSSEEDEDDDETLPGERRRKKKRKGKKRAKLGMLGNMRLQARWRAARSSLKWDCGWDVVLCLLWGAAAVMALGVGKSCPAGTAEGWCNLYNGAIACAVIAVVVFIAAIYCDIVGLKASKNPPKARI